MGYQEGREVGVRAVVIKLFLSALLVFGSCASLVVAEGIADAKGSAGKAGLEVNSSVGIEAVQAIRVGLAVGSQKIGWSGGYGLNNCQGWSAGNRTKHCRCNPCTCYPYCKCGLNGEGSSRASECCCNCSVYNQSTPKRPFYFRY